MRKMNDRKNGESRQTDLVGAWPKKQNPKYIPAKQRDVTNWLLRQQYVLGKIGLERDEFVKDMLLAMSHSDDVEFRENIAEVLEQQIIDALFL